jgi:hypothetical protein
MALQPFVLERLCPWAGNHNISLVTALVYLVAVFKTTAPSCGPNLFSEDPRFGFYLAETPDPPLSQGTRVDALRAPASHRGWHRYDKGAPKRALGRGSEKVHPLRLTPKHVAIDLTRDRAADDG